MQQPGHLLLRQSLIDLGEFPEFDQFTVFNIGPILFGEQIFEDPIPAAPRNNDGAVQVLAQTLLEDSAAQIVGLAQHHLPDG